jgi:hypothetical protein
VPPPHSEDNSIADCNTERSIRNPQSKASRPGLEPGPGPSEGPMRSTTPSGHRRADDWIRTSMIPLTRRAPFSGRATPADLVVVSREWCGQNHPAAYHVHLTTHHDQSKGDRRDSNPHFPVHSRTCNPLHHGHHFSGVKQHPDQDLNLGRRFRRST